MSYDNASGGGDHFMTASPSLLSVRERRAILAAAFLGWLCAGVQMGLGPLVARSALRDLWFGPGGSASAALTAAEEAQVGQWFAWYLCAFLVGAAAGGVLFGRLGDVRGRVRAMGLSVLCSSALTGVSWFVQTPGELVVLRFLASLGIGGMWPAGVALTSESWPEASRPAIAGAIGTAANIGILVMALIGLRLQITPDSWRWVMLVGATPVVLGALVLWRLPESPRWLAERSAEATPHAKEPFVVLLRPPLLGRTLLGVALGTVPLLGTWSSSKWLIPWADAEGSSAALTQAVWATGAVLGSAAGGWLASQLGRRTSYFLVSLGALAINVAIYRFLHPADPFYLPAVFLLGLVATVFFGWLPLYLPELFPTRVRATGTGMSYNLGRLASAAGVLAAGSLMTVFEGDYATVGEIAAWVYALGLGVILLAPDTSKRTLSE
jgi:MFS family permease